MGLIGVTDILMRAEPDRNRLRTAVSRAFGIAPGHVAVEDAEGRSPILASAKVVLLRQPGDMPGDFPAWFSQVVASDLESRVDDAWDAVARALGILVLSEATDDDSMVHLADGSRHILSIPEDDAGGYRMTPELRRLVADSAYSSMRLAS